MPKRVGTWIMEGANFLDALTVALILGAYVEINCAWDVE